MNTVLVRYGHSVRKKRYTKIPNAKICSESRYIDENQIVQRDGETFGIFRRLAAEWRRAAFVYNVIGNMAIATSVDGRGDSSHRKRRMLRRMKNGNVSSEFISLWFASVYGASSYVKNRVSPLVLRLQK